MICFSIEIVFSEQDSLINREWHFDKVTSNNLFDTRDSDVFDHLNQKFKQAKIVIKDGVLTIDNHLYDDFRICFVEYNRNKKTQLEYFLSKKTFNLFQDLMKTEGHLLSDDIHVISSSNNDEECLAPYDELIEDKEFLWIISDDHVIFFKEILEQNSIEITYDSFCESTNPKSNYDGYVEYECDYPDKNIEMVYLIIREDISDKDIEMREYLPNKDSFYISINPNSTVSYTWLSDKKLQIFIDKKRGNETTRYILETTDNGTKLIMKFETIY